MRRVLAFGGEAKVTWQAWLTISLLVVLALDCAPTWNRSSWAWGQEMAAARPQYAAGDRWVFSRNGEREEQEFVRYEGDGFIIKRKFRGQTILRYYALDLNQTKEVDEDGTVRREYVKSLPHLRFPLQVGKTWTEAYLADGIRRTISVAVAA